MPDFTPPPKPTPTHKVPASLFIEAAHGRYDNTTPGLLMLTGKEIEAQKPHVVKTFSYPRIDDEDLYMLLDDAEIIDTDTIELKNLGHNGLPEIHFLFYGSVLPTVNLQHNVTKSWLMVKSFVEEFQLYNSQTGDIYIDDNSQAGDISILSNSQAGDISIHDKSQARDIFIHDKSQAGNIRIYNSHAGDISIDAKSQAGYISIDDNSHAGYISIYDNSQAGDISIDDNSHAGDISIDDNSQAGDIYIMGNSQAGDIDIMGNSQAGDIYISGNSQAGDIYIDDGSRSGIIYIENSRAPSLNLKGQYITLHFNNASVPFIKLDNCHLQRLVWQSGSKGELYMHGGSLNHLQLHNTALLKESVFLFSRVAMHVVQMEGLLVQGQLMLRGVSPLQADELPAWQPAVANPSDINPHTDISESAKAIQTAYQEGLDKKRKNYEDSAINLKTKFANGALFRIANSSLGKTEITGSDLQGFRFEYRDSKLLECFLSGTQLPKNKVFVYGNDELPQDQRETDVYTQKVSFYNQLRKLYEGLGDIVEAGSYQSKAMDNQQQLLRLQYKQKDRLLFSEEGFNLLTFRLNKISNDHGESWRRALGFFCAVSVVFYCLYYISLFYNLEFSLSGVWPFLGDYFRFIDITHKTDFLVKNNELSVGAKALDFVGRLCMGYSIYQFIVAFRRHGRKGI